MDVENKRTLILKDNPFNGHAMADRHIFLVKKVEKLTSAAYKVTSFISDNEPIKWKIRALAITLLDSIIPARPESDILHKFDTIQKIVSFLEVSHSGSAVSKMNLSILKGEYENVKPLIAEVWQPSLVKDKLGVSEGEITETKKILALSGVEDGESYGKFDIEAHKQKERWLSGQKKDVKDKRTKEHVYKRHDTKDRSKRQSLILGFIKDKKEVSIKDILDIPTISSGVSSKTIQRELIDLVHDGILTKKGERRWSTYFLSQN